MPKNYILQNKKGTENSAPLWLYLIGHIKPSYHRACHKDHHRILPS